MGRYCPPGRVTGAVRPLPLTTCPGGRLDPGWSREERGGCSTGVTSHRPLHKAAGTSRRSDSYGPTSTQTGGAPRPDARETARRSLPTSTTQPFHSPQNASLSQGRNHPWAPRDCDGRRCGAALRAKSSTVSDTPLTPVHSTNITGACGATCGRPMSRELHRLWCDEVAVESPMRAALKPCELMPPSRFAVPRRDPSAELM